jgi:hypothetical protein
MMALNIFQGDVGADAKESYVCIESCSGPKQTTTEEGDLICLIFDK